jgi:hypothetical protein
MGAVFLLVLLPIVGAAGFLLKTCAGEGSGGAMLAAAMILFLACVIGAGVMRMARQWDDEDAT